MVHSPFRSPLLLFTGCDQVPLSGQQPKGSSAPAENPCSLRGQINRICFTTVEKHLRGLGDLACGIEAPRTGNQPLFRLAARRHRSGVLSPLLAPSITQQRFEIVFGTGRYRAAQMSNQSRYSRSAC
jgi:hypothetical protein